MHTAHMQMNFACIKEKNKNNHDVSIQNKYDWENILKVTCQLQAMEICHYYYFFLKTLKNMLFTSRWAAEFLTCRIETIILNNFNKNTKKQDSSKKQFHFLNEIYFLLFRMNVYFQILTRTQIWISDFTSIKLNINHLHQLLYTLNHKINNIKKYKILIHNYWVL